LTAILQRRLVTMAAALVASCSADPEAPPQEAQASPAVCKEGEIDCRNRQWLTEFREEERRQPKLPLDEIFGNWVVVAALKPEGRTAGNIWVTTYAHRDVWIGARISLTREAITIEPPRGAPVVPKNGLGEGDLYPRCTNPDLDTHGMVSASPIEDWIDLWRHFGFDKPVIGRPALVHCNGTREFPDDGSGHVAELTVEEAGGIEVLYLYDRENLIVQWGALEFLLQPARRPAGVAR
jgi:hypothetical protein